jgi:hypothetical protein
MEPTCRSLAAFITPFSTTTLADLRLGKSWATARSGEPNEPTESNSESDQPRRPRLRAKTLGKVDQRTIEPYEGLHIGKVDKPERLTAFFVELTFPSGAQVPYKFTSQINVVPETLPYEYPPKETK